MIVYSKDTLKDALINIRARGWIKGGRPGNVGSVGNTLEDLLEIKENNLPIPNAAEWELKAQRGPTTSLTTLFHLAPSPRALHMVPKILLPCYGWSLNQAPSSSTRLSFRQTIGCSSVSPRGFKVVMDNVERRVVISFNAQSVSPTNTDWLHSVADRMGNLNELNPQPYWGLDDLCHHAGAKLTNCFYSIVDHHVEEGVEYFQYSRFFMLEHFSTDRFLTGIASGNIMVDFDARTGHDHGTKFRARAGYFPLLYDSAEEF
jgi:hypothetical protein